jgi:lipid-A-disaccharide synthase
MDKQLKFYIIAGEASGDLHGGNLIKHLHLLHPGVDIRCWGGEKMESAGAKLVKHYKDLAFMGFVEVLFNIRTILRNIKFCKIDIETYQPDALVLIDYPGFNMRIAKWAKENGIPVFYYISPQIWAWKQKRVHQIKRDVERVFCVLPFEQEFYNRFQVSVSFVGHPLLDVATDVISKTEFIRANNLSEKPIIALLPGSRTQEINTMLPIMLTIVPHFPDHQFIVAGAPGQDIDRYRPYLNDQIHLVFGSTYALLKHAEAGLITSGTATLEAGLFQLPQVVCYKANPISYAIAKRIIKVKYISLVNLILDRPAVKELIQHDLNTALLLEELKDLLYNPIRIANANRDYIELRNALGGEGASKRTANEMLKIIELQKN